MPTNRKRISRGRRQSGLTPAQHLFLYGETIGEINEWELLDLTHPNTPAQRQLVAELREKTGVYPAKTTSRCTSKSPRVQRLMKIIISIQPKVEP